MADFNPDAYLRQWAPPAFDPDAYLNGPAPQSNAGFGASAIDTAKQLGVGIAQGIEAIPSTVPTLIGLAGRAAQAGLDKFAPGFTDPKTLQNESKVRELAAQARGGGISDYLPKPQTEAGKVANTVGNFLPSAAGMSGSLARNVVSGAAAGAGAYGGEKVAPTEDAKPYFSAAGAMLGGAAGLKGADAIAQRVAARSVPTTAQIKAGAEDLYRGLTERTVARDIPQSVLDQVANEASAKLNMQGPRASVAPNIHKAIDEIRTPGYGAADAADLVSARQNVKAFFQNAMPDPNKAGAAKVIPLLDAAIEKNAPGVLPDLQSADKSWSVYRASEALDKKLARAELRNAGAHSGLNLGNQIRQRAADMLLSNDARYLSPEAKQALDGVVRGTITQNALRFGSNLLGGGGGAWTMALGAGGVLGGYEGHPEMAALPLVGLGLRMGYNRSVANQARMAGALMRSQAPVAASAGITAMAPPLSKSQAGLLSALLALPAERAAIQQVGSGK